MADEGPTPDYYPLRWKIADAVEDLFVLHRGKLAAFVILVLAGLTVGALLFLDDDGDDVQTSAGDSTTSSTTEAPAPDDSSTTAPSTTTDAVTTSSTTTTSTTTSSTTTTSTTTTTTEAPVSPRAPTDDAQLAATEPGAVISMNPGLITLPGGLPSDSVADETLSLAQAIFPDAQVVDEQIVDDSFPTPAAILFRLSASDLFEYNRDTINPQYLALIDQFAAAMVAAPTWRVEVAGHTDDTGPSPGNQRLSERRAQSAANRLISQGVDPGRVTVVGYGEDRPLLPNDTDQNRLANRRVEFLVTR